MEFKIGDRVKWHPWGNKKYPAYRGIVVGMFIKDVLPDGSHEIGYQVRVNGRKKKPPIVHLQHDDWYRRVIYRLVPRSSVVGRVSTGSSTKSVTVTPDE